MAREVFANNASTTLASAITTTTATSISVTSATPFPASGNFRIIIDAELMLVTAVSGTTFTVVRGAEGSTAATHSNGANVTHILTKQATQAFLRDNVPFADDTNRNPFKLLDASGNTLTSASFTVVNGGLATVSDENSGGITIHKTPVASGEDVTFLARSAPATPYQVYAAMEGILPDPAGYCGFGIGFRESGTGKLTILVIGMNGGSTFPVLAVYNFNSPTSFNAPQVARFSCFMPSPKWFSIKDDGTNLTFYVSHNGIQWLSVGSMGRTSWMTGAPNQIGFCMSSSVNTYHDIATSLLSWLE